MGRFYKFLRGVVLILFRELNFSRLDLRFHSGLNSEINILIFFFFFFFFFEKYQNLKKIFHKNAGSVGAAATFFHISAINNLSFHIKIKLSTKYS